MRTYCTQHSVVIQKGRKYKKGDIYIYIYVHTHTYTHITDSLHCTLETNRTLQSDLMDYSPPGSSDHGILQARILEWVAMPFSRGSS